MSAIWGAISMNQKALSKEISTVLSNAYTECVIDRMEEINERYTCMGCGIQYFTETSYEEKLPLKQDNVWFTADAVIDNRAVLMERLSIPQEEQEKIPDGEILRRMYQTYGDDCLNDLLGAYAFVNYDETKNRIDLIIDAVGNRTVYYTLHQQVIYFSSLLTPLEKITKAEINERWMTDFLAMDHLVMVNEPVETPYEGILRVAPGHHVAIENGKIREESYWNPLETVRKLKYKDDSLYKETFRKIFFEAVKCTLRETQEQPLSAMLSGGYDSTAVVSVASRMINDNEIIHTYTSVPIDGYQVQDDGYYVEDESELVKQTAKYLGNLSTNFVRMTGVDSWSGHKECLKCIEMPYKSPQNLLWMQECMRLAKQKGSRIMITGSYGNTTISFTNLDWYMNLLMYRGRLIKMEKELSGFQKTFGFNKSYTRKKIIKNYLLARMNAYKRTTDREELFGKSFVKEDILLKTNAYKRIDKFNRKYIKAAYQRKVQKSLIIQDIALRQIGELEQKFSLSTGVLLRDPTRDKRVIEFCLSIPFERFSTNGEERRLVSVYLADIVPSWLLEKRIRGRQSADLQYRLSLRWDKIRDEWMLNYRDAADNPYVDTHKALRDLDEKPGIEQYKHFDLSRHIYTQLTLEFIKNNNFVRLRDKE